MVLRPCDHKSIKSVPSLISIFHLHTLPHLSLSNNGQIQIVSRHCVIRYQFIRMLKYRLIDYLKSDQICFTGIETESSGTVKVTPIYIRVVHFHLILPDKISFRFKQTRWLKQRIRRIQSENHYRSKNSFGVCRIHVSEDEDEESWKGRENKRG